MPLTLLLAFVVILTHLLATPILAFERGAKKEAITLVQKALTHVEAVRIQRALEDFKQLNDNPFRDRDLYVFIYDYQGNNLVQSQAG